MKMNLLIIDPQNDFVDPRGSLCVPGADRDMDRLADFLNRWGDEIDDIHVTLDSHREVDIAHPIFWVDSAGNHPQPFTTVTIDDLNQGRWKTRMPGWNKRAGDYLRQLEADGRYQLMIWPPHCIIGSWGHAIYQNLSDELRNWEKKHFAIVDYVTKGSNIWTEHYSAVKAEVVDPEDPSTQLNMGLINLLQDPEMGAILIAGEALSHCVANTIRDIANHFGKENIKKFILLEDCCSNVSGCEQLGTDFVREMAARGMTVKKSTDDILAVA